MALSHQEVSMNGIRKLGMVCLAYVLVMGAGLRAGEDEHAADHAALRSLRDKLATAINHQDMNALSSCFAKTFTFTTLDQRVATRPEQVKAIYNELFQGPGAIISSLKSEPQADELTRFLDDHTGIAEGSSKETYVLKSGKSIDLTVRWTATVVKEADGWKVAAAHVGMNPLDNPLLTATNAFWKKVCLGSILGGLLLGVILGRFSRRTRTA